MMRHWPNAPVRGRLARHLLVAACVLCLLWFAGPAAAQQRDPLQRIGHTVADDPPGRYRFESLQVASADGTRQWRVRIGVPQTQAPAGGFPSFWMLDGNAALIEFDPALLAELADRPQPPVLVFIGYDNDLRIDTPARTRDYTFVGTGEGDIRNGGGADAFLDAIGHRIHPEVARRVALDPHRRALWGHSLGGLFVLHALYARTGLFQTYAAASPALWWAEGALLGAPERDFAIRNDGRPARVLISLGGAERSRDTRGRDLDDPRVREHLRRIAGAPADAAPRLAQRLDAMPGLDVRYREFAGLGHGPMFRASLMDALHLVTGVADHSATPRPQPPAR